MCEPVSLAIASFAVSAASTVSGYMAQSQAADQQNALYEANRKNAIAAHEDTNRALTNRQSQEMDAAAAEKFDVALDAKKARATNVVAAGEAGVSGLSVEALLREFSGREARYVDRVDENLDMSMAQLQDEKRASGFRTVDRINSVQRAVKPSFLDAGLKIAGAGLDAYTGYKYPNTRSRRA